MSLESIVARDIRLSTRWRQSPRLAGRESTMTTRNVTSCVWTVTGMDCGSCAGKIRRALERLPGVTDVDVALMSERLRLTLDEDQTSRDHVETAVKQLGFGIETGRASCGERVGQ